MKIDNFDEHWKIIRPTNQVDGVTMCDARFTHNIIGKCSCRVKAIISLSNAIFCVERLF